MALAFISLSSCNSDSKEDWTGMEYFEFEVSGQVLDSYGNSIKGITVSVLDNTAQTDSNGKYKLKGRGGTETLVTVNFIDTDASENGGFYQGVIRKVQLDYVKGKHGPYLGLYKKDNIDATLTIGLPMVPDMNVPIE